jgi:molybdate transport system ATP-binding protein
MSSIALKLQCDGFQGFSLDIECELSLEGVTAIYGPSGSGKTTLLDCIAGLRTPADNSTIQFGDKTWFNSRINVPTWERQIGYVFNDARLFPHLSVEDNIRYGAKRSKESASQDIGTVANWLNISSLLNRLPESLSAGEKQRVAIARALLYEPRLLLLDEPFANLDQNARLQSLNYLQRIISETSLPVLFVSHNIEEVCQLADNLMLLEKGELKEFGNVLELSSRLDNRLSREENAAAIVTANVTSHDTEYDLTILDLDGESLFISQMETDIGSPQRIRIPARDVSICLTRPKDTSILNVFSVTIDTMEQTGAAHCMLRLQLGSQHLLARLTRKSAHTLNLKPGDTVYAQIKSAALLVAPLSVVAPLSGQAETL